VIEDFLRLPLAELERLLAAVRSGRLQAPIRGSQLEAENLKAVVPHTRLLAAFESSLALETLLASVVTQRRQAEAIPRPELVWSGPEPIQSRARHTAVVVRELFERAQREVFIAGYSFRGGDELLAPLHTAMVERGVSVQIVLDCSGFDVFAATPPQTILRAVVDDFWHKVWVHGRPWPRLFYDPRTLQRQPPQFGSRWFPEYSMHAKCVVVDGAQALVGSANFTERAHASNIEVGVAIREPAFAQALLHQWGAVRSAGFVRDVDELGGGPLPRG
jgi:phosphatidylserine/phosphatidylglycerophosphate/cardiolipin synthase-like enzyme